MSPPPSQSAQRSSRRSMNLLKLDTKISYVSGSCIETTVAGYLGMCWQCRFPGLTPDLLSHALRDWDLVMCFNWPYRGFRCSPQFNAGKSCAVYQDTAAESGVLEVTLTWVQTPVLLFSSCVSLGCHLTSLSFCSPFIK